MLSHTDIVKTLHTFWQYHGPATTPCQFPGVPFNASAYDLWMEFWVTQVRQQTSRHHACEALLLLLDIHCFSRSKSDKRQIDKLVDEVRHTLQQRVLHIPHPSLSDHTVGLIRFHEPVTRDLTRLDPERTLQHQVLSLTATIEEMAVAL